LRLAYIKVSRRSLADIAREAAQDGKFQPQRLTAVLVLWWSRGRRHSPADRGRSGVFSTIKIELLQLIGEHFRVKELFREIAFDYARD